MNPVSHDDADAWLDDLLVRSREPSPPDDGFSAAVMRRIDAGAGVGAALPAAPAEPAPCISPSAALGRLPAVQRRERRRQSWTTGGVLAAAGIGMLTIWAQPGSAGAAALVVTSVGLMWLLLRDPQF